jgi:hypothetical protein
MEATYLFFKRRTGMMPDFMCQIHKYNNNIMMSRTTNHLSPAKSCAYNFSEPANSKTHFFGWHHTVSHKIFRSTDEKRSKKHKDTCAMKDQYQESSKNNETGATRSSRSSYFRSLSSPSLQISNIAIPPSPFPSVPRASIISIIEEAVAIADSVDEDFGNLHNHRKSTPGGPARQ